MFRLKNVDPDGILLSNFSISLLLRPTLHRKTAYRFLICHVEVLGGPTTFHSKFDHCNAINNTPESIVAVDVSW